MSPVPIVELIARICHEVNRAYCTAIGDSSQPEWDDAPAWQKQSCIDGVRRHLAVDNMTPEDSHIAWCTQKLKDGWSWGVDKDVEAKKHPCLIPYDNLPLEQRIKDWLFRGVVEAFKHSVKGSTHVDNKRGNGEAENTVGESGTTETRF